jgi:hypothetical protein
VRDRSFEAAQLQMDCQPLIAHIDVGHAAGDTEALKNLERRAKPD